MSRTCLAQKRPVLLSLGILNIIIIYVCVCIFLSQVAPLLLLLLLFILFLLTLYGRERCLETHRQEHVSHKH